MGLKVLHAGCGSTEIDSSFSNYEEVRLDADVNCNPDILASVVAMPMVEDEHFDAVFCSHTLEHLAAHEVPMALGEFYRVLKPGGLLMLVTPNLQSVVQALVEDKIENVMYHSGMGPVTALDIIFGHRTSVALGNHFMGHKTGFTKGSMERALKMTGFTEVSVKVDHLTNLFAHARREKVCQQNLKPSEHTSTPTSDTAGSRNITSTTRESCPSM